jgi:broad specificity phosphatase PhoE
MTKRITLLRHGKTGMSGKYVGSQDVPLSTDGVFQINKLKKQFIKYPIDGVISSPMLRCRQTSEILFAQDLMSHDEDLCEVDFGCWENLTFQEIVNKNPELVDEWSKSSNDFCFPEGECMAAFVSRVQSAGQRIKKSDEKDIMIVAHGGVIRYLLCYFLNLEPSHYLLFNVLKGRYSTLDLFDEGAVLTGFNLGVECQ